MTEKRADELVKGDVLELNGDRYVVLKAKVKGKTVHLRIDGRRGTFDQDVKAKTRYRVIGAPIASGPDDNRRGVGALKTQPSSGQLHSRSGAQQRWATHAEAIKAQHALEPPLDFMRKTTAWDEPAKGERALVAELGAKLVGVEVEGGKLIVPPVTDATLFGHLLTMHRIRYDGVTFEEAKAWAKEHDPAGPATATQVIDRLSFQRATEIHDEAHRNFAGLPVPHWHRERAPR
jgi:hypothetical protein